MYVVSVVSICTVLSHTLDSPDSDSGRQCLHPHSVCMSPFACNLDRRRTSGSRRCWYCHVDAPRSAGRGYKNQPPALFWPFLTPGVVLSPRGWFYPAFRGLVVSPRGWFYPAFRGLVLSPRGTTPDPPGVVPPPRPFGGGEYPKAPGGIFLVQSGGGGGYMEQWYENIIVGTFLIFWHLSVSPKKVCRGGLHGVLVHRANPLPLPTEGVLPRCQDPPPRVSSFGRIRGNA